MPPRVLFLPLMGAGAGRLSRRKPLGSLCSAPDTCNSDFRVRVSGSEKEVEEIVDDENVDGESDSH